MFDGQGPSARKHKCNGRLFYDDGSICVRKHDELKLRKHDTAYLHSWQSTTIADQIDFMLEHTAPRCMLGQTQQMSYMKAK